MSEQPATTPVLDVETLSKTYPGQRALIDASLQVMPGEVHALIGGGETVQMLYRIGHAGPVGPTPRRGLETHLV